ncbi:MAG: aspartyl/asparaginyl beta-hydroxylase domain-containing protein [Gammaproteobacteria bacterium]
MLQFMDHVKNCLSVRRLLKNHTAPRVQNLYWYDMRLVDAIAWRGIVKVLLHQVFGWKQDEIAGNYDLVNLYYADPIGDGLNESRATVWNYHGLDSRPWFDEPNPVKQALEANADVIIAEYQNIASRIGTHPDNASLTDRGRWTGMFLYAAKGVRNDELCQLCPETTRIIEGLPLCTNFGFVMFSGLEAHSHITPHSGSSNLRLRHHLGIDVPEPDKAKLRVGREWRGWAQGKGMAFDDSFEHEVLHEGDQERVVLVVDVWHPSLATGDIEVLSHPVFQRFGKRPA